MKEAFKKYNNAIVSQTVLMLERKMTVAELKTNILPHLKQNKTLQESDFIWRINMLSRRKIVKKTEILILITQVLKYFNF